MEQREKSVGADVSAMPEELTSESPRARATVAHPVPMDAAAARESKARELKSAAKKSSVRKNSLRETRIEKMMSKAELARRANLSVLTIDRVEKGLGCRMDTKRKILEALGMSLADRVRVFGEEE